jgi:hypothetical protein
MEFKPNMKLFSESNPEKLEAAFNAWSTPDIEVVQVQFEINLAIQKFFLVVIWVPACNTDWDDEPLTGVPGEVGPSCDKDLKTTEVEPEDREVVDSDDA